MSQVFWDQKQFTLFSFEFNCGNPQVIQVFLLINNLVSLGSTDTEQPRQSIENVMLCWDC